MTIKYILSERTPGANPFQIFEALATVDQNYLEAQIKRMPYDEFLKTAYWFAVSQVAKSRAGMRCQVCNCSSNLSTHHRTYDTHGREHANVIDLVVLDANCHGLFHGHKAPEYKAPKPRLKVRTVIPHAPQPMPEGETIILTKELIDACRANGAFTNATTNAFGLKKADLIRGWTFRLIGKAISRIEYTNALEGKFIYREKINV